MKVITELIEHFISSGELDEFDLRFLEEQGFYRRPSAKDEEFHSGNEEDSHQREERLAAQAREFTENEAWNEPLWVELELEKKGKGSRRSRSRIPKPRLTFEQLNQLILAKIPEWEQPLQPLLSLTGLPNGDAIECLKQQEAADKEQLSRKLRERLLRQPFKFSHLKTALFFTGHLDFVFSQLDQLPPKKREAVRRWSLDHAPSGKENREGFRFILHCVRLQRAALLAWADIHEEWLCTDRYPIEREKMNEPPFAQLALAFLLLEFSDPLLPVQAAGRPVYYFFKGEDLEAVFTFFLTLFPRRYHYFYQNMRRVRLPGGSEWFSHVLRQHLAWMPPPAWVRHLNGEHEFPLVVEAPVCRLTYEKLERESDWFTIAGVVDVLAFFTSATGFALCHEGYKYKPLPMREGSAIVRLEAWKWGAVDRHGKLLVFKEIIEQAWSYSEGLARVEVARLLGKPSFFCFLDKNGERALQGQTFSLAEDFSEGLASVAEQHCDEDVFWFYVDASGKAFHQFFTHVSPFHEGKANVLIDAGRTFMDKAGKFIGESVFDNAWHFREDRAVVREEGLYGCIDGSGNLVIPCIYDWIWSFNEGKTAAFLDGKWQHIDRDGNLIGKLGYHLAEHFSEGLAGCLDSKGFYFVDASGKVVSGDEQFSSTSTYRNGLALVRPLLEFGLSSDKYFIDRKGKRQFADKKYGYGYPFSEGYTPVRWSNKFAIMDTQGKLCTDFVFEGSFEMHFDGLAKFESGRGEDFPNFHGSPCTAMEEGVFSEGTAILKKPDQRFHLVFKSDFREQVCERVAVICQWMSPGEYVWRLPETGQIFFSDFGVRSIWKLDGDRVALEDDRGRIAVVNWAETLRRAADEPL